MAAMPIYHKKPLKSFFFLQNHKSDNRETCHTEKGISAYKVYITMTYSTTRSFRILHWKNPSTLPNIFSLDFTGHIEIRFYIEHLCFTGTKVSWTHDQEGHQAYI